MGRRRGPYLNRRASASTAHQPPRRANQKWEPEFTVFLAAGPFKSALLQVGVGHFNSIGKPQRADKSDNIWRWVTQPFPSPRTSWLVVPPLPSLKPQWPPSRESSFSSRCVSMSFIRKVFLFFLSSSVIAHVCYAKPVTSVVLMDCYWLILTHFQQKREA